MIEKKHIQKLLQHNWKPLPICIPSYKRWERKDNKTLTKIIENCDDEIKKNTYVFVRKEQEDKYRENFPFVNIVVLPKVNGLAGTRQFIQEYSLNVLHAPYFIDMDDDITDLKYVFHDEIGDHLSLSAETNVSQILRLASAIAKMAFIKDKCLLGNLHRVRFASNFPASQNAYVTNKGATPRQVTFVNAKGLVLRGINRNLEFDETGDDVGFVAEISKMGGDFFQIPCLCYAFVDDAVNSVIRNDNNRKALAQKEYNLLRKYPMNNYLKISHKFDDGSYKFSDIDYSKYRKATGKETKTRTINDFCEWIKLQNKRR